MLIGLFSKSQHAASPQEGTSSDARTRAKSPESFSPGYVNQQLVTLCFRIVELSELWVFMAKVFPKGSPVHNDFMALDSQIGEKYKICLKAKKEGMAEGELLKLINKVNEEITTLVKPEVNKRRIGEKPLHRLMRQKPQNEIEKVRLEKMIARLIQEGANPTSRTSVYPRKLTTAIKDALSEFPWVNHMVDALFNNPKKSVFEVSQSTDVLDKALNKHQIVLSEDQKKSKERVSGRAAFFTEVKHVLDRFSPAKPWIEKLNASYPVARLIGLHEELMGQKHLEGVHQYLIANDRTIIGEFFRIISNFKKSEAPDRLQKVNADLALFFTQLGISNIADVFLNIETSIDKEDLKSSLEIQVLYYLITYVFKSLNVNLEGKIIAKFQKEYDGEVEKSLKLLESVGFSPAYALHTEIRMDERRMQELSLHGAPLGNRKCQYNICAQYFSFLIGYLNLATPPAFMFPKDITKELLIKWVNDIRSEGYTEGLAYMQNFMINFFTVAGAYYQEDVTAAQKSRIREIADIVKAISGDKMVNQFVDSLLNIQGDKASVDAQYKALSKSAAQYLLDVYTDKFKRTPKNVDAVLHSDLMHNVFERHAVFQLLTYIEIEMNTEMARLREKNSQTSGAYIFPLSAIADLKSDLLTETAQLRYLHTNDPNLVIKDAENILKTVYQNIKAKDASASHMTSLRGIKHSMRKFASSVLPEAVAVNVVQRSTAIKTSYNLYQTAKKISEGNPMERLATPRVHVTPRK